MIEFRLHEGKTQYRYCAVKPIMWTGWQDVPAPQTQEPKKTTDDENIRLLGVAIDALLEIKEHVAESDPWDAAYETGVEVTLSWAKGVARRALDKIDGKYGA